MLLFAAETRPSRVHGRGVFTTVAIPRGTPMWRLIEPFDVLFDESDLARLDEVTRRQIERFVYFDRDLRRYVLCGDDARYYNHSDRPNTGQDPAARSPRLDVALLDIATGEEIFCDYRTFTDDAGL